MSNGLVIGRFHIVHNAHEEVIKYLATAVDNVIIGLGSSQYNLDNRKPGDYYVKYCLTLDERIQLLKETFEGLNIKIVPIEDTTDDNTWRDSVLQKTQPLDFIITEKQDEIDMFRDHCKILVWPFKSDVRNGIVIDYILKNQDYKELVPSKTYRFLETINIRDRLKKLHELDLKEWREKYLAEEDKNELRI